MNPLSLCCLGNSHLAAIKQAWDDRAPDYPDLSLTFFGAIGGRMRDFEIHEHELISTSTELSRMAKVVSGGKDRTRLEDHDGFVLIGLDLGFRLFLLSLRTHLAPSEFKTARTGQHLVSDACLEQSLADSLAGSLSVVLLRRLRAATEKPVYVFTDPYISETAFEQPNMRYLSVLHKAGALVRLHGLYTRHLAKTLSEHRAILVKQPDETLATAPGFTLASFSQGSVRLKEGVHEHDSNDVRHMNKHYGALMLRELARHLPARPIAAPATAISLAAS